LIKNKSEQELEALIMKSNNFYKRKKHFEQKAKNEDLFEIKKLNSTSLNHLSKLHSLSF